MINECVAKGRGRSMVKEDFHVSRLSRSRHETLLGVLQHEFNLFARYTREPV